MKRHGNQRVEGSREKDGNGGFGGGLCAAGAEGEQQSLLICLFALGGM